MVFTVNLPDLVKFPSRSISSPENEYGNPENEYRTLEKDSEEEYGNAESKYRTQEDEYGTLEEDSEDEYGSPGESAEDKYGTLEEDSEEDSEDEYESPEEDSILKKEGLIEHRGTKEFSLKYQKEFTGPSFGLPARLGSSAPSRRPMWLGLGKCSRSETARTGGGC